MKTVWKSGLTPEQAKNIELAFEENKLLRRRLTELINAKITSSWEGSVSRDGYDVPNWAYKQADARGYERALKEVISLIN